VLLQDAQGKRVLLLGNEAIARGILEAGISVVSTYPGTPASEIGDTISNIAKEAGIYMEYSTNEIVAMEVAAGAANCQVRALTAMKHVGLNVAADLLMTLAYTGVRGGYVIVTADDPECYSSQNEQDNRYYALLSNLPCMEPSNAQEAKDMTVSAIEISEKLELPVLLRTTTRVSHTREPVVYGTLAKPKIKGEFIRDAKRLVMVPAHSRVMHKILLEKLEKAKEISEKSSYNQILRKGKTRMYGVISSGSAFNYAAEALELLGLDASILKLGITHPLPEKKIGDFLKDHEKIIVVEELEPYLEVQVKTIAKDYAPNIEVYGKMKTSCFPRDGELSTSIVAMGFSKITGKKMPIEIGEISKKYGEIVADLPKRPPILCAGCPHRASFYAIRKVAVDAAIYSTDIGCYALGATPPLRVGDLLICMGASIGTAQGIRKATGKNAIAILGDSTFFHAGIPGLINAVYNNHKIVVVVVDNLTTAMTGHQPHPGTGTTGMRIASERVLVENVAKGCGVKFVRVVNPFKVEEAESVLREALKYDGPSVLVFRAPCALLTVKEHRREGAEFAVCVVEEKCTNCMACVRLLGCPALILEGGKVRIDEALCTACGLCGSVCPFDAIKCVKVG